MSESPVIQFGEETILLESAIDQVAGFFSCYDSGLFVTPNSGVIYHRSGFGSEQIVYQSAPEIRPAVYKNNESSPPAGTTKHMLAFPYVILLMAFEGGMFKGIRHFYSPEPISSLDQQLYLANLPNTNTLSYNNTSLGWVCLYLRDEGNHLKTLEQKVSYGLARHDPVGEPYNYANMSRTDGYQFYKKQKPTEKYLWDPSAWETKTQEEGLDWVCDAKLWIPAHVLPTDTIAPKHDPEGTPYTLRRALFDEHNVYYSTPGAVLLNQHAKASEEDRATLVAQALPKVLNVSIAPKPVDVNELLNSINFFPNVGAVLGRVPVFTCFFCKKESKFRHASHAFKNLVTAVRWGNTSVQHSGELLKEYIAIFESANDFAEKPSSAMAKLLLHWACDECKPSRNLKPVLTNIGLKKNRRSESVLVSLEYSETHLIAVSGSNVYVVMTEVPEDHGVYSTYSSPNCELMSPVNVNLMWMAYCNGCRTYLGFSDNPQQKDQLIHDRVVLDESKAYAALEENVVVADLQKNYGGTCINCATVNGSRVQWDPYLNCWTSLKEADRLLYQYEFKAHYSTLKERGVPFLSNNYHSDAVRLMGFRMSAAWFNYWHGEKGEPVSPGCRPNKKWNPYSPDSLESFCSYHNFESKPEQLTITEMKE